MQIKTVKVESLTHDPANVRTHAERNIEAIKASLNRFGQQKPIVVDSKGVVVAGNGTLQAAKQLGWSQIKIIRTDLEKADAIAFAIADNRTAELAEWDDKALVEQLNALQLQDENLLIAAGFNDEELGALVDASIRGMGAEELNTDDFSEFKNECPKCGFGWND